MSKSNLPPLSTEAPRPAASDLLKQIRASEGAKSRNATPRSQRSGWWTWFAASIRWLHIYVSLLGFTALMFFAVTGMTLNHPTWFGADQQQFVELQGEMNRDWLNLPPLTSASPVTTTEAVQQQDSEQSVEEEIDYSRQVDRLEVVEYLRNTHGVRGAVSEFRVDEYECMVLFKSPGYSVDVYVNRENGSYNGSQMMMGAMAIMNDLHKGRDSGPIWSLVIDLTALLMVFVSLTGIVLIFYLKRRRFSGILTAVVGTILFVALFFYGVP